MIYWLSFLLAVLLITTIRLALRYRWLYLAARQQLAQADSDLRRQRRVNREAHLLFVEAHSNVQLLAWQNCVLGRNNDALRRENAVLRQISGLVTIDGMSYVSFN